MAHENYGERRVSKAERRRNKAKHEGMDRRAKKDRRRYPNSDHKRGG